MPPTPPFPETSRALLSHWWNDAWNDGLWAASWRKSLEDLSPAQAAWTPPLIPGATNNNGTRHSIWQIVLHMIFWREGDLRRLDGGPKPDADEIARNNFPPITDPSPQAWQDTQRRFAETQSRLAAAFANPATPLERIPFFIPHDSYHFGQINYLRAMQGMKPIE